MIFLKKSQPAPTCLTVEKAEANGDYKCGDVLERLKIDFKNKCYLCEQREPTTINVEHFKPHRGDLELKFDWENLFWACGHCNNTKLAGYTDILNCTVETDQVEIALQYNFNPFPKEKVAISTASTDSRSVQTSNLLNAIYNGTTTLKRIESDNLRSQLLKEIKDFQDVLIEYYDDLSHEIERPDVLHKISRHLSKGSPFTSFKRWIIRNSPERMEVFGHLLD